MNRFPVIPLIKFHYNYGLIPLKKCVDHDQLASMKPADLDLHCFQKRENRILKIVLNTKGCDLVEYGILMIMSLKMQ